MNRDLGAQGGGRDLRPLLYAAPALACLGAGLQIAFARGWGADDAYISFRYAENLAGGHGLVFNVGERVEGYTNLLFVLLLSAVARVLHAPDYAVAVVLNTAALGASALLYTCHVDATLGRRSAGWAALFFVLCPVFYRWVAAGLESPLVLLLQLLAWFFVERSVRAPDLGRSNAGSRIFALSAVSACLVLVRADGALFPAIATLYLLVHGRRREGVAAGAATGSTLAAHVAWRLSYYGYPLPNTYYAKVSGPLAQRLVHGLGDLAEIGILSCLLPPVVALVASAAVTIRESRGQRASTADALRALPFETWMAAVLLPVWVYVGGDVYAERFLLVLYPAGFLSLLRVTARRTLRVRPFAAAAFIASQLLVLAGSEYARWPKYDAYLALGEFLRGRGGETLAIDGAGKIPYVTGMPTLDMLGLNDLFIGHEKTSFFVVGHNKFNAAYVMRKHPSLIAAWLDLHAATLDLDWGLTASLYIRNGYRLRYLLNMNPESNGRDVVDVAGYGADEVRALVAHGYHYAVLESVPRS